MTEPAVKKAADDARLIAALRTRLVKEAIMPARVEHIKARLKELGHKLTSSEQSIGTARTGAAL